MGAYIVVLAAARNARAASQITETAERPAVAARGKRHSMLDDIYNRRILELAADIPRLGRLPEPDASTTAHSKLCGSTVTVDVALGEDGRVADFAHEVRACALGQASSSLMARHVVGMRADDVRALRETMRAMLKQDGPAPTGEHAEFAVFEPVRAFKARHASTLLTFDATVEALDRIAAERGTATAAE